MRLHASALAPPLVALSLALATACEQLDTGAGDTGAAGAGLGDAGATDGGGGVTGAGCAVEPTSGVQLCSAVSTCPNVVVDGQVTPSCGFRIRGAVVDLVCACQSEICSMGAFTTCAEAARLLSEQSEVTVCTQVSEGRCTAGAPVTPPGNDGNPACDRQCVRDCGGGAACAAVCNCD